MYSRVAISLAILLLARPLFAQTSKAPVPISGTATYGLGITEGDFAISGRRLVLSQGLPDGPEGIGTCNVGTVCSLSFTFSSSSDFCEYCTGYSSGIFDGKTADYLNPPLTFTGTAFYSGGSMLQMHMKFSGTIVGYKLVDCSFGCNLGPEQFEVNAAGTALTTLTIYGNVIEGAQMTLSGSATPVRLGVGE